MNRIGQRELDELLAIVKAKGPHRVMVSEDDAKPGHRAREMGITSDVVFVRGDGWTLGAPKRYALAAERQWADEWIGKLDLASGVFTPINGGKGE